jgi:rRNA-processing protein FCF1
LWCDVESIILSHFNITFCVLFKLKKIFSKNYVKLIQLICLNDLYAKKKKIKRKSKAAKKLVASYLYVTSKFVCWQRVMSYEGEVKTVKEKSKKKRFKAY